MKKSPIKKFIVIFYKLALTGFVILFANLSFSQTAPVTTPKGGFKIDGYLRANTPGTSRAGDWVPQVNGTAFTAGIDSFVLSSAGVPEDNVTTRLQRDVYATTTDDIFTQGSKFIDAIGSLHWGTGGAPNKNDIHNGVFHASGDNGTPSNQWVFIGGDRLDVAGTSYIDFQFLQGTVTLNANGTFTGSGLCGGRNVNDINVSMEYNNGGTAPKVVIYRWVPTNDAGTAGTWDSTGSASLTGAYAKTNLVTVDVPFGGFAGVNGVDVNTYQPFAFVEAAINVTQLVSALGGNCAGLSIKTLWITTKASSSSTAALKDFMQPISIDLNFGGVSIDPKGPFCLGASAITLTGSPSGGTFTGPGTSGANGSTFTPNDAGVGTHTIVYTASAGVNCLKTASTQIIVNANPSVNDPADQTVCNNASTSAINFSGSVAGATYNWTNDNTTIGLAASGSGNIASFTALNTGTSNVVANLSVSATANGCTGSPQTFTITVKPTPTVNDPPDQTLCNGASTTAVNFTGAVGSTTFNWTNNNTTIGLGASGSTNIASFNAINSGTTNAVATITVTPTANSCTGSQQQFTITVKPTPTVNDPVDQTVCTGASISAVTFTGAVTGTTFGWTNNLITIGLGASGSGNISSFAAQNGGASSIVATIAVTPTANGCPGQPQSFTITVLGQPAAPSICIVQPTLCGPATGSITVTSPTGPGYEYSKDGGANWQTSPTFNNLAAGSNPSIIFKTAAGCISAAASCGSGSVCAQARIASTVNEATTDETAEPQNPKDVKHISKLEVKAYPNPFNDRVKFLVSVPEAGNGSLEVMNMLGQKVKTVFKGQMNAGSQSFEMVLPSGRYSTLFYILRINGKQVTGKLVQRN